MGLNPRPVLARLAAFLLLTAGPAAAQGGVPDGQVVQGRLSFDARATLGDFTGVTDSVRGVLHGAPMLGGVRGRVEAPVASMVTGNDRRDRDLLKSMEADQYPLIWFELDSVIPDRRVADSMEVILAGELTLHGVTRQVEIPGMLTFEGGMVRFRGGLERLNVKDYDVGGLSKFLGMLSMNKEIDVHVDVAFQLEPPPGS